MLVWEPQAQAFLISCWMWANRCADHFIFCHSHLVKCLLGQDAHSDHDSKRQSFEEVPETFKCITGGADETEDVEGPQGQPSCKTHGKVVFISWNLCFHNMGCGYLASQQNFMLLSPLWALNTGTIYARGLFPLSYHCSFPGTGAQRHSGKTTEVHPISS